MSGTEGIPPYTMLGGSAIFAGYEERRSRSVPKGRKRHRLTW
ncbi:MAG TPA: hypothetical protein V6D15_05590 [Oculatellaceae cyanobacterium]